MARWGWCSARPMRHAALTGAERSDHMPEQTLTTLESETKRILQLLDAMEVDALGAMLTDDAQSVDEITRGWTRGRAAIDAYLDQLRGTVSDIRSHARD